MCIRDRPEQGWLSGGFCDGILRQVLPRSGADADRRAGRSPAGGWPRPLSGVSFAAAKRHQCQHLELPDAGAETQSITGELLHRRRRYLRGFLPPQRGLCLSLIHIYQRSGDGAAENCVPSAGSCAGSCKDDSRPARKPQRSAPFRIKGAIIHRSGEIAVLQTAR